MPEWVAISIRPEANYPEGNHLEKPKIASLFANLPVVEKARLAIDAIENMTIARMANIAHRNSPNLEAFSPSSVRHIS